MSTNSKEALTANFTRVALMITLVQRELSPQLWIVFKESLIKLMEKDMDTKKLDTDAVAAFIQEKLDKT